MSNMDANTAMKHHKMKVNINATIEVPLETMLAVRAGDGRNFGLGPVISAALRSAAIDAIKAHPASPGDTLSSPPIGSADLRAVDHAASEEAAIGVKEMEEMLSKSLLEDKRRLKTMDPDASKILAEESDTQPASAADVKNDPQNGIYANRIEVTVEDFDATEAVTPFTATGNLVNIRVGYKNLQMTRQVLDSSTMNDIVADIRASLPKVPDHYRRLVWFADSRSEAEGIVLRGWTKLCNTDISKFGTVHLQAGECKTAGPDEGPAPEEREIRLDIMVYNDHENATEVDDSWVDKNGVVWAGPEMIAAQKARAQDPRLHSVLMVVNMRPTNTFWNVKKAMYAQRRSLEACDWELYLSFEDRMTGIDEGGRIYFK